MPITSCVSVAHRRPGRPVATPPPSPPISLSLQTSSDAAPLVRAAMGRCAEVRSPHTAVALGDNDAPGGGRREAGSCWSRCRLPSPLRRAEGANRSTGWPWRPVAG